MCEPFRLCYFIGLMKNRTSKSLTALPPSYHEGLSRVAPLVAFTVAREIDEHYRWDGDGPDPIEQGFDPYDITVTASVIIRGQLLTGEAYLGGSYFRPDEPTGDIHGYLNQLLDQAAKDLLEQVIRLALPKWTDHEAQAAKDLKEARQWLVDTRRAEYEEQRREIEAAQSGGSPL